jgi:hypothetical protein
MAGLTRWNGMSFSRVLAKLFFSMFDSSHSTWAGPFEAQGKQPRPLQV